MNDMSKVRIVQLLCPQRHCILAAAYESADGEADPKMSDVVQTGFQALVQTGANPWCDICKSRQLEPEDRPTRFKTMAEARPFLEQSEQDQTLTREFLRTSRN